MMAFPQHFRKVFSWLPIVILGLTFAIASADSGAGEQQQAAWCDERIRELETQFNSRLTNEVQSTKVQADASCQHRLTEAGSSSQQETASLQARLAETLDLLATTEGTVQELQTRVTATQVEQSDSCASRIQELQSAKETELDACVQNQNSSLQQQMNAVQEEHLNAIKAAVEKTRLDLQEEHARKLKMVQDRRDALTEENSEMKASLQLIKSQLQETKNELFTLRQELFQTNEKLREASKRWYHIVLPPRAMAYLQQALANVQESVHSTYHSTISSPTLSEAKSRALPHLEKAGLPQAYAKIQVHARPMAGMVYSVLTTVALEFVALLQTLRREMPVYWKQFVEIASKYWNEFITIAGPKMEVAWETTKVTSGRVWEQIREKSQPLVDQIPWDKLEPHIQMAKGHYENLMKDTEWIRQEFAVYAAKAGDFAMQVGETMHEWVIVGFHQTVKALHLLLDVYEAPSHMLDWTENLHTQSDTIIWYIEAALGTLLAMMMTSKLLGFGGRRSGKKIKTDPHLNGAANGVKKQRIAKRHTEKGSPKKKQVHFSGR